MKREEEYKKLIQDEQTHVVYTHNDAGEGRRIIVADIHMKPRSKYANDYINPHQLFNHIPHESLAQCPVCGDDWVYDSKEDFYPCASNHRKNEPHAKLFIHKDTHKTFSATRYGNTYSLPPTGETVSREIENEDDLLAMLEANDPFDWSVDDETLKENDPFAEW